jgi:hypothetical protein
MLCSILWKKDKAPELMRIPAIESLHNLSMALGKSFPGFNVSESERYLRHIVLEIYCGTYLQYTFAEAFNGLSENERDHILFYAGCASAIRIERIRETLSVIETP